MLDVPASTLSRYAREFSEHLSETARGENRRRSYNDADVLILGKVRELVGLGVPFSEIAARLQVIEDLLLESPGENRSALQLLPSITRELEKAQFTARAALDLVEKLTSQVDKLPDLERRLDDLGKLLERETLARQALENELQEYRSQPWYKRVFRR